MIDSLGVVGAVRLDYVGAVGLDGLQWTALGWFVVVRLGLFRRVASMCSLGLGDGLVMRRLDWVVMQGVAFVSFVFLPSLKEKNYCCFVCLC